MFWYYWGCFTLIMGAAQIYPSFSYRLSLGFAHSILWASRLSVLGYYA